MDDLNFRIKIEKFNQGPYLMIGMRVEASFY